MALMARSANDQLGGTTERRYIKKILKNAKLLHAVVLGAGKRCVASGKALQAESAASENIICENIFAENFAISK